LAYFLFRFVDINQLINCCGYYVLTARIANGGNLLPDPVFSPLHQNCLEFFWNASVTFPRHILATPNPKEFFQHLLLSPKFWWKTKGTPAGEKQVSSVTRVTLAADGKI